MNCIIIDDDATARLIIKEYCNRSGVISVVSEFESAIDAIKFLNNQTTIDLVFLDIHMPTFSGFDFIQTLKSPPKIILTTSDKDMALKAFEYKSVVDYLTKPITEERFSLSLEKLDSLKNDDEDNKSDKRRDEYIFANVDRRLVKIHIPSIYLIEAKGDYINIKTLDKNYIVHSTLKKIEDKLPDINFFKVHRSFIINTSEIVDIEDNTVLVKKDVVPVSRSKKGELMEKLNLL